MRSTENKIQTLVLFIIMLFGFHAVKAQSYVDSLILHLNAKSLISKIDACKKLSVFYIVEKNPKALSILNKADSLILNVKLKGQDVEFKALRAYYLISEGNYRLAEPILQDAILQASKFENSDLMAMVNTMFGEFYSTQRNFKTANFYFKDAKSSLRRNENNEIKALCYWIIGNANVIQNNYGAAILDHQNAVIASSNIQDNLLRFLSNYALLNDFLLTKDYENASPQLEKTMQEAQKLNLAFCIGQVKIAKAKLIFYRSNNYTDAITLLNEANTLATNYSHISIKIEVYNMLCRVYLALLNPETSQLYCDSAKYLIVNKVSDRNIDNLLLQSSIFLDQRKYDKALASCNIAYQLSESTSDLLSLQKAASIMSILYYMKLDYKSAFNMLHKSSFLKDSINTRELIMQQSKVSAEISFNKRIEENKLRQAKEEEVRAAIQKNKEEIRDSEIRNQRIIIGLAILALALGGVFFLNITRNLKKLKKFASILETQKEEIDFRRQKLQLQNNQIVAQTVSLERKNIEITDSILYAKRIQKAMLTPDNFFKNQVKDYFIFYRPKDIVSGDFYWANKVNNKLVVAVADCTGHGVPGAFMSLLGINFLNEIVVDKKIIRPADTLDALRHSIINLLNQDTNEKHNDGIDIALFSIDFENNLLEAALANSSIYIFRKSGGKAIDVNGKSIIPVKANEDGALYEIKPDKFPVGSHIGDVMPFTNLKITLYKNDLIFAGTDGYSDQFGGPNRKKLKYSRLENLLFEMGNIQSSSLQKQIITDHFDNWKGDEEQVDDVLALCIRF